MSTRCETLASALLSLGVIIIALTGARSEPRQIDAVYGNVFDTWVGTYRPATAILAVRYRGQTLVVKGHGVDPHAPSLIGSMSKPITGVCIGTLIRDGKLAFTTPLRQALAGFFRRHGAAPDRRLETVTIEQLLTHRSGLLGNDEGDPMQEIWRRRGRDGMAHLASPEPLLAEHFKHRLAYQPGTKASYTNTGFVVLVAVIEEATGQSYEDYCRASVFGKLGISSARLHPDWRQFSGARGWTITGADYLAFLDVYDPSNPFLGDVVKTWVVEARTKWRPGYRGQFDGLGIPTTIFPEGWRVLHSGILDFKGKAADGRPIEAVIHSHAYREATGFSAFHAMTPAREGNPALGELDGAVHRAHERATGIR